ncbi:MAG TPA: hypothetical protein VJS11_07345 [Acidobacteriaceae bacterium]|nr:hypothetical protein [Acidobacteriaceae bacterium]
MEDVAKDFAQSVQDNQRSGTLEDNFDKDGYPSGKREVTRIAAASITMRGLLSADGSAEKNRAGDQPIRFE